MENQTLFVVFISKLAKNKVLRLIRDSYSVKNDKVFVLEDLDNPEIYILTFNGILKDNLKDIGTPVRNIISAHRKKFGNTIYTVNALNEVIKQKTGGVIDPTYKVDWEDKMFENKLLITRNNELKIISTKLKTVINITRLD